MLDILKAILFGIVEGITEWLPISSTGHIIILDELIRLSQGEAFMEMFEVVIQLGAIMAVVLADQDREAEDDDLADVDQGSYRMRACRGGRHSAE